MSYRFLASLGALTALLAGTAFGQAPSASPKSDAKSPAHSAKTWTMPRTPDGHPDLQGIWNNATLTPMERPAAFAEKATLTDAEASAYEKHDLEASDIDKKGSTLLRLTGDVETGGYNNLFIDRGSELARVDGVKRTSLVIDPPDGHVPPVTEQVRQTRGRGGFGNRYDSVKDRPLAERCIIGFGSTSGPPMLPALYNSDYQIVQTADTVMIMVEMVHDVRVIRMNGEHAPQSVRKWLGDSIGRWEGDTLVVDTTNFNGRTRFRGSSENLHVIERFRRVDANTILYRATIDDPATFTKPWTMEYPFVASQGPIFEYACHEGNYAMPDILGGARKSDAEAAGKTVAK
jgi:hypothetical protein